MSSYIAFELRALEEAANIARSAGVSEDTIIAGMARMWAHGWRAKSAVVQRVHVRGFFGSDVSEALVAFGYLERVDAGLRIRGADRYLRIAQARSEGGKKAAGNLKRGAERPGSTPAQAGSQPETLNGGSDEESAHRAESLQPESTPGSLPAPAGNNPEVPPGCFPGLTSSIEHRTTTDVRSYERTSAPAVRKQRRLPIVDVADEPEPSHRDAVKALVEAFAAAGLGKYLWQGAKDGTALSALLKDATLDEVLARWRIGLAAPSKDWASCRTVAQLRSKWNDLAPPAGAPPVEHDPTAAEAVDRLTRGRSAYIASRFADVRWRREGDWLVGVTADAFFAGWAVEQDLGELWMRIEHVERGAAA